MSDSLNRTLSKGERRQHMLPKWAEVRLDVDQHFLGTICSVISEPSEPTHSEK